MAIGAALLAFPAAPAAAQNSPCAGVPEGEYQIAVVKDVPAPRLNHELRRSEIGELTFHGPHNSVLGLATSQLEVEYDAAFRYMPAGDGFCFWTDRVTVTLRYHAFDVYVAAEYAAGSCPYNAILAHELRHVDVAHKHLDYYTPNIKGALTSLNIPTARTPTLVASPDLAQAETLDRIGELLRPPVEVMQQAMIAAQEVVDSPKSYRQVRDQCADW
ncbi:MAG: hypothetical protein ACREEE_08760 [Dongiaceae bacterium]